LSGCISEESPSVDTTKKEKLETQIENGSKKTRNKKKLETPEEFFPENSAKINWVYVLKCLFLDYLLDFPKECWYSTLDNEVRNQASGMILCMLDKKHQTFFLYSLPKKEQVYIFKILRNQAVEFVKENIEEIRKCINLSL